MGQGMLQFTSPPGPRWLHCTAVARTNRTACSSARACGASVQPPGPGAWPCLLCCCRCKEGNLSYFYDNWGYDMYDIVAQFDADHVPTSTYLSTSLPAFLDPQVHARIGTRVCPLCASGAAGGQGSSSKGGRGGSRRVGALADLPAYRLGCGGLSPPRLPCAHTVPNAPASPTPPPPRPLVGCSRPLCRWGTWPAQASAGQTPTSRGPCAAASFLRATSTAASGPRCPGTSCPSASAAITWCAPRT